MHADNMPSSEPAPRESVGQLLRQTRASLGVDLEHVAETLRIRLTFLQAIEDGRNQDLPGPTYAVGFVRAYADYLGLDSEEIVRRYKDETSIVPRRADLEFPTPVNEGGIPTARCCSSRPCWARGIYGGWYWMSSSDRTVVELIQDVPARFNDLIAAAPDVGEEGAAVVETLAESADRILTSAELETSAAPESDQSAELDELSAEAPPTETPAVKPSPAVTEAVTAEQEPVAEPEPLPEAITVEEPLPAENAAAETQATDDSVGPQEAAVAALEPEDAQSSMDAPAPVDETALVEDQSTSEAVAEAETVVASDPEPEVAAEEAVVSEPASESDTASVEDAPQVAAVPAAPDLPDAPDLPESIAMDGAVYGAPADSTRVVLAAVADSWIQIRAGDELIATRLLREGERFQVPDRSGLTLMVGNAGGLRILVDGRALPPLGDEGQVRRGIRLTPEALLSN